MSQTEKAGYFRALKEAGVNFEKHYREYTTEELKQAYTKLRESQPEQDLPEFIEPPAPASDEDAITEEMQARIDAEVRARLDAEVGRRLQERQQEQTPPPLRPEPKAPLAGRNPDEMAGQRQNSKSKDEPIRTDENGLIWFQEEVRKPAFAKPRGRRVLKYMESGVETKQVKSGEYVETFEVAGSGPQIPAEVKITLPSYQVGIYKDPRLPFKVHVYNEIRGFDFFEVQNYYGGPELVPTEIKRMYVENVLCYDIRTTVRAIQTEYRQLQLAGKVK